MGSGHRAGPRVHNRRILSLDLIAMFWSISRIEKLLHEDESGALSRAAGDRRLHCGW